MLRDVLKQYWGYSDFLPLQQEAMNCVLEDRDSLVVLPTGGGKSLCYQTPGLCRPGMVIVVSPLIALMKDQVDGLRQCGIEAATVHSGMSADAKRRVSRAMQQGTVPLFYTSPEQLLTPRMLDFLANLPITAIAIDEAHCISAWGHDFRPEYQGLAVLRDRFPRVALHAYTATATPKVREEIITSLRLRQPEILIGDFFRPNLRYRVSRRDKLVNQLCSVLDRHRGQSGLIYCISRADSERLAESLTELRYSCAAYHAGLTDAERTRRQEDFLHDRTHTIVATVAFGMGINKSNVRFVMHAAMPKSLAHYQQETGRAGRDGLEAECLLLYGSEDSIRWRRTFAESSEEVRVAGEESLKAIYSYCVASHCRHRLLVEHFGQPWTQSSCGACDVCLGQFETVDEPLIVGQKILSCVLRTRERFGAAYVAQVLAGSRDRRVLANRHERLSTYGLLTEFRLASIRDWIEQLVEQGFLVRDEEFQQIKVTPEGRALLRGEVTPTLMRAARSADSHIGTDASLLRSWEGVDRELFDTLRHWRAVVAGERGVPAFMIFSDATLRDIARRLPRCLSELLQVHGVGERKAADYAEPIQRMVAEYCAQYPEKAISHEQQRQGNEAADAVNHGLAAAFSLFDQGLSAPQVALKIHRAESTVIRYLEQYLTAREVRDPAGWIDPREFAELKRVARYAGIEKLKPIYDALHGRVDYHRIRIAVAILANQGFKAIE